MLEFFFLGGEGGRGFGKKSFAGLGEGGRRIYIHIYI